MGLFKKKGDKGNSSPAPQNANPYAQPPANPYQQAKARAYAPSDTSSVASAPPPYDSGRPAPGGRQPSDQKNPYGSGTGYAQQDRQPGGGYGANPYGGAGYGNNDRYGSGGQPAPPASGSRYGAGGYGGMGGGNDNPYGDKQDDASRNALFGAPPPSQQQQSQDKQGGGAPNPYAPGAAPRNQQAQQKNPYASADAGGFTSDGGYAAGPSYNDKQLTAEEEEEQELQATKNEIRQIKQKDVSATRNALRIANRAEEVGRDTLARLGAQGEALYNAEKSLDLAHNHNKRAEDKARELKTLNRSMFAVHVSNPFTSKSRQEAADQAVLDRHLEERDAREATRRAAYLQDQRMQKNFTELDKAGEPQAKRERNLAERAKYQFEADSEDEEMENEIDANLDALSGAAGRLNLLARATGKEVDSQNQRLDELAQKSDKVDLGLAANHARINRIR